MQTTIRFARRVVTTVLTITTLAYATAVSPQTNSTRLLPASFADGVRVEFKQDGRVLDLVVVTPGGKWVVTDLSIKVTFQKYNVPVPGKFKSRECQKQRDDSRANPFGWTSNDCFVSDAPSETHKLQQPFLADRSVSTHVELKLDMPVTSVVVTDARGREATLMDRAKGMIN